MTFSQSLTAFGDHVLDKALKTVEAGACFPSNGQLCACVPNDVLCPTGRKQQRWIYSCFGLCAHSTIICC